MSRRRAAAVVERAPGDPIVYQCARVDEDWHATQEQASPPHITAGGAYTICAVWASFTRGFEKRRPTCAFCLRACERDEGIYVEPPAAPVAAPTPTDARTPKPTSPSAAAPARVQKPAASTPSPAPVAATQKLRDANAAQEADFAARLNALVEKTKNRR